MRNILSPEGCRNGREGNDRSSYVRGVGHAGVAMRYPFLVLPIFSWQPALQGQVERQQRDYPIGALLSPLFVKCRNGCHRSLQSEKLIFLFAAG